MRDRKGIIIIAFDLPAITPKDKANYRKFRSYLIKNGYMIFQESLYYKIIKNSLDSQKEIRMVSSLAPDSGNIIALPLTLNVVYKIISIRGTAFDMDAFAEDVFFFEST